MTSRRVTTTDGVRLAVYESGDARRPTIIAVHGYPDNHAVWDGVAAELADEFHAVTYDVRGTGASDKPTSRHAYRMSQLVADLVAVTDAVSPDEPVHLLGHDWGSIQLWPAVTDERLAGRIATFTSISGPSLDYAVAWLRRGHTHPLSVLRQLARSYYLLLFQLPALPELAVRRGAVDRGVRRAGGTPGAGVPRSDADKVNGLQLYRANILGGLSRPRPRPVDIPVQVIAPESDAFVLPDLAIEAPQPWVADLTPHRIPGGHWVVAEQPGVIADLVRAFVQGRQ